MFAHSARLRVILQPWDGSMSVSQQSSIQSGEKPRVVQLTESAQTEVRRLLEEQADPAIGLRLGIKGGGCSGLSYVLDFTAEADGDTVIEYDDFRVYLDRKSVIYLSGIRLDHQGGLQGRGFVFENPMATNTCGCGESFSI